MENDKEAGKKRRKCLLTDLNGTDKILLIFMLVFILILVDVELKFCLPFTVSSLAEEKNELISITCSSLASGICIYFLTSVLPAIWERRRLRRSLDDGIERVNVLLANMILRNIGTCIFKSCDNENENKPKHKHVLNINKCVEHINQISWDNNPVEAKYLLANYQFLKNHILNFLLVFQKHLTEKQVKQLYDIATSNFEQLITPNIRPGSKDGESRLDGSGENNNSKKCSNNEAETYKKNKGNNQDTIQKEEIQNKIVKDFRKILESNEKLQDSADWPSNMEALYASEQINNSPCQQAVS